MLRLISGLPGCVAHEDDTRDEGPGLEQPQRQVDPGRRHVTRGASASSRRAIALLAADRTARRAADLADRLALSVRSLHRLFTDHVGLGPAWGYYDQAHLARDFTAMTGTSPGRYAAAADADRSGLEHASS